MSDEACDSTSNTIEIEMNQRSVAIYPNPTQGELWINFPEIGDQYVELIIFDLLGKPTIQQKIVQHLTRIDLSGLMPGNYFYSIQQSGAVNSGKIIKVE